MNPTFSTPGIPAPGSRWLVVDDEPDLSAIISDALAGLRLADVENFTSSSAALEAFVSHAGNFDLVFTDRDMPGLDGLELSRRLRAHAPDVKVILVSAHTDDLTDAELWNAGIRTVVNKPFSLAGLETAARFASAA